MVGSSVWKSLSPTPTPAPVSAFRSVELAGVPVAGQGHGAEAPSRGAAPSSPRGFAPGAPGAGAGSRSGHGPDGGLSRSACPPTGPDPAAKPLKVRPQAAHPGRGELELCQLDLKLSRKAVRMVGEDVEDHRGAIDHRERRAPPRDFAPGVAPARSRRPGLASLRAISAFRLGHVPRPGSAVGVGRGRLPGPVPQQGVRHAGGSQKLLQLGQWIAVAGRGGEHSPRPAHAGARAGSRPLSGLPRSWVRAVRP